MLTFPPPLFRKGRRKDGGSTGAKSGRIPILLHGTFGTGTGLSMLFDGPIAIEGFSAPQITVNDPASGSSYQPTGTPTVVGSSVTMGTTPVGSASGSQTTLNAGASSGVMAADSSTPWTGVSGFALASS
jgi:hypothetical protein